ncbi:MAG: type I DNA topoisomerase [Planctomycetota bacterium]
MTKLVIVESPTKAKTLRKFLGDEFVVESSVGHVRDLPKRKSEIPSKHHEEAWAKRSDTLGVDVDHDFRPFYVVHPDKKDKIKELKALAKEADELLLATDEDREGEAISWHLLELLQPKVPVRRMVFHEITKRAILEAVEQTRQVDDKLVDAQETRRIVDRLFGFGVSPILWRKVRPGLSAGRVQSVAIRMVVEREQARLRFKPAAYWGINAELETTESQAFEARLATLDGKRLAAGKDFDPDTGTLLKADGLIHLLGEEAEAVKRSLEAHGFAVTETEEKPFRQSPSAPFTTSSLQQEGNRKLRFGATRTMRAAQVLYENGFITYMRTDSVALSNEAVASTRAEIEKLYGAAFLPAEPRFYKNKSKNAQEAHEAIRPVGTPSFPSVAEVEQRLGEDPARVYELIWKRTMACQMKDAEGRRMTVRVKSDWAEREAVFVANGQVIDFAGYKRAYVEGSDDPDEALGEQDRILPPVAKGDALRGRAITPKESVTQPPSRLTEASLVKALEESGVGRPSTYASIIRTIERREYTFKKGNALVPTWLAFAVVRLLHEHMGHLIDYDFTAAMEDRLDEIARGEASRVPYLREFYFGNGQTGLKELLDQKKDEIDPREVCSIVLGQDTEAGEEVVVRVGRYGPYLQRGEDRASLPDGLAPDELDIARARELLAAGVKANEPIGAHPDSGDPIYVKTGRFGPYVQLGDAMGEDGKPKKPKPKMVSLLPGMSPDTVTLDDCLELLTLPRVLGQDAEGVDVEAHFGRYGAYIKRGKDTRSLGDDDDVLTVQLPRALELLAQEKKRGRFQAKELKVFEDVEQLDGVTIKMLNGRYGPYVTDGETNASLPREMPDPQALTVEQAVELILARRAKGPSTKKKTKKKAAKKTSKKAAAAEGEDGEGKDGEGKATKKKAAKKKATKKKAAKKKATKKKASKKTAAAASEE